MIQMNNIWKYIERLFAAIGNVVLRQPLAPLRGKMPVGQKGVVLLSFFVFVSCSTNLEPGEQLFTGLKPIDYQNHDNSDHFTMTQAELEAALATAPNGALFGSSYYRTIPYALWIHNACEGKEGGVAKWIGKTFGKAPVLMGNVNPELRVSVAENVLQNHGYFRGNVDYDIIYGKAKTTKTDTVARPRTAKIAYTVDMGPLYKIDTISYHNFPQDAMILIQSSKPEIKTGDAFDVAALDAERNRIADLFHNNGYYYYNQSYTSYLADTVKVPEKVQLQVHMADSLPEEATQKWVIGKVDVNIRRQNQEQLTDTTQRRSVTLHFHGKKSPIRGRVILADVRLRPKMFYSQSKYEESMERLLGKGVYSTSTIEFKKELNPDGTVKTMPDNEKSVTREGEDCRGAGILDMTINCVLDKPYDVTLQANYHGNEQGRMGPGVSLGFAKRNAFRGGEVLGFNLSGNYEFQTRGTNEDNSANYEIKGDLTLTFPRLLVPSSQKKRRRWQTTPTTIISVARETINKSGFFRRHILSAEMAYTFQPTKQTVHQLSPLIVEYDRLAEVSDNYKDKVDESPVLKATLKDHFLTKMKYSHKYTSPSNLRNPIYVSATVTEASNLLTLGYDLLGMKKKEAFKTPISRFVKLDVDYRKTWMIDEHSSVVAHAQFGIMKCLGDSATAPYSEYYYVGGANSLRAFAARSVGPGRSYNPNTRYHYVSNVGDMKCLFNLEYRPRLFGSLYGAVFLDAGNVWAFENQERTESDPDYKYLGNGLDRKFKGNKFLTDFAVGAGVGIRYDLDFFVLRLDWGFVLHDPSSQKSGYFNFPRFSKGQCLNFAIGYPF